MPLSTPAGVTYYVGSDAPNLATITQGMANSIDQSIVPTFATTAARAAAITSPRDGQLTYQQDTKRNERWSTDVGAWVPLATFGICSFSGTQAVATANTTLSIGVWSAATMQGGMTGIATGLRISRAGAYLVSGSITFDNTNTTGRRGAWPSLQTGGTGSFVGVSAPYRAIIPAASGGTSVPMPAQVFLCNAGDVISAVPYQDSGATINYTQAFITAAILGG